MSVSSACGTYDIDFNGTYISAIQVVGLFIDKYNMSRLADTSGSFCLSVEETWKVGDSDGTPIEDIDGDLLNMSDPTPTFNDYGLELDMTGQSYHQEAISLDGQGHGWPEAVIMTSPPLNTTFRMLLSPVQDGNRVSMG
ncbi:hypothetical protein LTR08_001689 [Meristemomyces frigidus]|nr:hypothetical protein LTR08_001689 [Meristemomyces frigidus]